MDDDQLDELKQFITATASQSEVRLVSRIDGVEQKLELRIDRLEQKLAVLEQKVDYGFAEVGEAIEQTHQLLDELY